MRSGVLSSVHAFATDPTRGFFIMVLIALAIGGALALFAWRAPTLAGRRGLRHRSAARPRCCSTMSSWWRPAPAVFVGTLYPLVLDAMNGTKISVGPPYYALTFAPIFFALLLLVPFGPQLGWRRGDLKAALARRCIRRWAWPAVAALAVLAIASRRAAWPARWRLCRGGLADRRLASSISASARARAPAPLPPRWPMPGLGVTLMGVAGTTVWRSEALDVVAPGRDHDGRALYLAL